MFKALNKVMRMVLGIYLVIAGSNYYLEFTPIPPISTQLGRDFMQNLADSGIYEAVKILEIIIGPLLLFNFFAPLCLTIIFPVTIMVWWLNMFPFESGAAGLTAGWLLLAINGWLMLTNLHHFRPMLVMKARPAASLRGIWAPPDSGDSN